MYEEYYGFSEKPFSLTPDPKYLFKSASHANRMAQLLARGLSKIDGISLTQEVQANEVFAIIPAKVIPKLQEQWPFHVWNEKNSEARLIASFDTTEEDIADFIELAREKMGSREKQWT